VIANPLPAAAEHAHPAALGHREARKATMSSFVTRKRLVWAGVIAVAVIGGGWYAAGASKRAPKETLPPPSGLTPRAADTVLVTAAPVELRRVERSVEAVGTLWGFEDVTISARVDGRVKRISHDTSDRVKPGEVLLQIDPTDLDLAVAQAEKTLQVELARLGLKEVPAGTVDLEKLPAVVQARVKMDQAQGRLDRLKNLAGGAYSPEELDSRLADARAAAAEYESQLLTARAGVATIQMKNEALKTSRQQLSDATVTVPVPSVATESGYAVSKRSVAEGMLVRPGTELFKLVIDDTLKLKVMVPERFSRDVKVGQKAAVTIAASPTPVDGVVARINPEVNATTRTFEVELQVANPGRGIKPGSFAKTSIVIGADENATVVPLEAIVSFAGITKIFVIDQGKAKEVPVTLGVQGETWVEIAAPKLAGGTRVVTSGQSAIAAGTPVAERQVAGKEAAK
jgi:RND family efflux transporter MFP subunit